MKDMIFLMSMMTVVSYAVTTAADTSRHHPFTLIDGSSVIQQGFSSLRADSELGQRLLGEARRVEDNNNNAQASGNVDMTWIKGYSIKFQGCHFVQQFNDDEQQQQGNNNNGDNSSNNVETKSLVRFKLCPYDRCNDNNESGCSRSYGEYIIGLDSFVNVYYEHRRQKEEYECELYLQQYCAHCDQDNNNNGNGGGGGDDNFNAEQCQYDCLLQADQGFETMCMDYNPYEENNGGNNDNNEQGGGFQPEEYMECAEYELPQQNNNRRRRRHLEEGGGSGLYIGPYCAEQGGAIYLGMFTDDQCSEFADSNNGADTFASIEGTELPFARDSIVSQQCMSCFDAGQNGNNNNNNNDNANGNVYQLAEVCQEVYQSAGKCEQRLPSGTVQNGPNNNACSYIGGIQSVREDGMIGSASKNNIGVSTTFIVLLSLAVLSLGMYVHYLRTKILRQTQRLKDPNQPDFPEEEMFCG